MKRPHPATIIAGTVLTAILGVALVSPSASATRSLGIESGSIASVDIFTLVDRALSNDAMTEERKNYEAQSNASLSGLQQQFMGIQAQLSAIQPDDPNAGALYQQYQQIQGDLQYASQQASEGYQTLIAQQIAAAYTEIYAAANEVGAEQGYSFVFATRSNGELLQTDTITGITQEILARPLVTPPAATDLTEAIRVKLGYPEEAAVELDIETEPAVIEEAGSSEQNTEPQADPMDNPQD